MQPIHDSHAIKIDGRQLAQHQAAISVLQRLLSAPATQRIAWLDLACGRGQIIQTLRQNLSDQARSKIEFFAYDVKYEYVLETQQAAESLGLASSASDVGDLLNFSRVIPAPLRFDFITLTNTVHEVAADTLASVLVDTVLRLTDHGTAFLYDVETVSPPELGAVPFSATDFRTVTAALLGALGDGSYQAEVGQWQHATTTGWNVQILREHLCASQEALEGRRSDGIIATRAAIVDVLRRRLTECRETLENLTRYGAETADEERDRECLLYELWAITRALELSS